MKRLLAPTLTALTLSSPTLSHAQSIQVTPGGSTPSAIGSAENFSGHVVVDLLGPAGTQTGAATGLVTFAPEARTAWHSHPAGQLLMVTTGAGWVQQEGQPRQDIKSGDSVWIPAGVKHWHGATDTNGMSHIVVTYILDGKNADWMELVSD
ncbi:cupin [Agaricicola taiwanensis]|uniref:Cupin n=1 Tax=Agaricicola taiwanensis TaxID=591372 RepID=A0A8J2YF40_9RHOB|nr:cupin domain-containing protein [Agaricicola taiwanensis]GGE40250.1 cupin [Agaricicola taiwanensis]